MNHHRNVKEQQQHHLYTQTHISRLQWEIYELHFFPCSVSRHQWQRKIFHHLKILNWVKWAESRIFSLSLSCLLMNRRHRIFFVFRSNSITRFCATILLIYVPPRMIHNFQEVNTWREYLFREIHMDFYEDAGFINSLTFTSFNFLFSMFSDNNEWTDNTRKTLGTHFDSMRKRSKTWLSTFSAFCINVDNKLLLFLPLKQYFDIFYALKYV